MPLSKSKKEKLKAAVEKRRKANAKKKGNVLKKRKTRLS